MPYVLLLPFPNRKCVLCDHHASDHNRVATTLEDTDSWVCQILECTCAFKFAHKQQSGYESIVVVNDPGGHIGPGVHIMLQDDKVEVDSLRPLYYGGKDAQYEVIKVIRAWGLDFELGNVLKYIRRAGSKLGRDATVTDLQKAKTYIDMEIERRTSTTDPYYKDWGPIDGGTNS